MRIRTFCAGASILLFALGNSLGTEKDAFIKGVSAIGKKWVKGSDGSSAAYSWVNFENAATGDALSFCSWNVNPSSSLESSPVIQASIELFRSDGKARMSTSDSGEPIEDLVRHQIVEVRLGKGSARKTEEAIEYTYVYGNGRTDPVSLCHGYIVKIEDTIVAVQHTSRRPISSELAFEMISELLLMHHNLNSYHRGEPRSIKHR